MKQLAKAISIAAQGFAEVLDKGGKPYILHCLRVMNSVNQNDEELMSIAVLHDVKEDLGWTDQALYLAGFSTRVVEAIELLTHYPEVPYDDYIKNLSQNPDCVAVKLADLKDNSDITRLKGLRKKDFERLEKYNRAWVYLRN